MTCHECGEKLTEYMEGELSAEGAAQVVAHVDSCADCGRTLESLRTVVSAVTSLPDVAPPPELRTNIARALAEHATSERPRTLLRRTRHLTSALAAAAAALVVIWAGTTHLSTPNTTVPELSAPTAMVAERATDEVKAETEPPTAVDADAIGEEADTMLAAAPAAVTEIEEAPQQAARHGATVARETAPVAEVTPAREEADVAADETPALPIAPPTTMTSGHDAERPIMDASGPASPSVTFDRGSAGSAGSAGAAAEAMIALAGDEEDDLLQVAPKYFAADATMVARMGPVGDTPFTVSVFPPTRRAMGEIVPATVTVETERDVQSARIRVRGLRTLEIVDAGEDGVIYRGALLAKQKTEQTVRVRAHEPGVQSMVVNLRSSNPEVETDLVVAMGEFHIEVPPTLQSIEVAFEETLVTEAIEQIIEASGMQVQVTGELPEQRVTKDFSAGVPAEAALRIVAEDVGWQVREDTGLQVVEPLPAATTDDG